VITKQLIPSISRMSATSSGSFATGFGIVA
jgi:hypothetical protein